MVSQCCGSEPDSPGTRQKAIVCCDGTAVCPQLRFPLIGHPVTPLMMRLSDFSGGKPNELQVFWGPCRVLSKAMLETIMGFKAPSPALSH
jgi:hypothetical protein